MRISRDQVRSLRGNTESTTENNIGTFLKCLIGAHCFTGGCLGAEFYSQLISQGEFDRVRTHRWQLGQTCSFARFYFGDDIHIFSIIKSFFKTPQICSEIINQLGSDDKNIVISRSFYTNSPQGSRAK